MTDTRTDASADDKRPHALYIRHKPNRNAADFLLTIENGWQKLFAQHCRVTMISDDFDLGEVCDRVNPDFIMLEDPGGSRAVPVKITNTAARPDIPRIGFLKEDPHDTSRPSFLRLVDQLKIDRIFITGTAAFRQSPELRNICFTSGHYIDGSVYRDYGEDKIIPLTIFGGVMLPGFYNWRAENGNYLPTAIPTMFYTHPGYGKNIPRHLFAVGGESYARMVNRSHFSLADGTREGYLVRKHLEIPACGAVLVSNDFAELKAYGFKDMLNCVLGTGQELIRKLRVVADNPVLYETIRKNGHDLVHKRFLSEHWRWFVDWFECQKSLKPGEVVQQQGYLGPFKAVKGDASTLACVDKELADSEFSAVMRQAVTAIIKPDGDLGAAEVALSQIPKWLTHLNEPWVPLGILSLLAGNPEEAKTRLTFPYNMRDAREKATCSDPEELAWLWLAAHLSGDEAMLNRIGVERMGIKHVTLRRIDALKKYMRGDAKALSADDPNLKPMPGDRLSIHWTGQASTAEWIYLVNRILAANKRKH